MRLKQRRLLLWRGGPHRVREEVPHDPSAWALGSPQYHTEIPTASAVPVTLVGIPPIDVAPPSEVGSFMRAARVTVQEKITPKIAFKKTAVRKRPSALDQESTTRKRARVDKEPQRDKGKAPATEDDPVARAMRSFMISVLGDVRREVETAANPELSSG